MGRLTGWKVGYADVRVPYDRPPLSSEYAGKLASW